MYGVDLQLFYAVNNLAGKLKFVDMLGIFFAGLGGIALMTALIAVLWFMDWGLPRLKNRYAAVLAFEAAVLGVALEQVIRQFYVRARPFVDHAANVLVSQSPSEPSFPSGHSTVAFALAISILIYNRKAGWWLFFIALLVGLGRIFVGVHYPFDVLGGLALAIFVALSLNFFRSFFVAPVVKFLSRE